MAYSRTDEIIQERAYDETAYDSEAFSQTQPARIAGTAHLLGLQPPDIETAHVFEIGCAAGGNIIPLAAYYPNAQFVGIDISGNQIQDGQHRINELGLTNIRLIKGSISDITPADGIFDYIIAHGFYSWVSPALRREGMRVCSENLRDNGVAYMSYNVYPGWHLKQIVRDMMLFHTKGIEEPKDRVKAAREILAQAADFGSGAYRSVLQAENEFISISDDYYIRHEELAEENHPVYFRDFIQEAKDVGLTYLAECDLPVNPLQSYSMELAAEIRAIAGDDYLATQQCIDFFVGRPFRMSLLVKDALAPQINRAVAPSRVEQLHFGFRNTIVQQYPQPEIVSETFDTGFRLFANDESVLSVATPEMARVVEIFRDSVYPHPGTYSFAEIAQHAAGTEPISDHIRETTAKVLLEMIRRKMLWYLSAPIACVPAQEYPKAYDLVRHDSAQGRKFTTSPFHERVSFSYPASAQFLTLLDGLHSINEIEEMIYERVQNGTMKLQSTLGPFDRMTDTRQAVHQYTIQTLMHMGRIRLLT